MKKYLYSILISLSFISFKRATMFCTAVGIAVETKAQLPGGTLLRVKQDASGFELYTPPYFMPVDSNTCLMSRYRADSAVAAIMAAIALKYNSSNPSGYISAVPAQTFASLTGKPTTLSGYGITDAYPLSGNPSLFLISISSGNVTTALGFTPVTNARTISTTSPLTGGGDLSANRTFAINNAAADNATKGAATFDSSYFDAASGLVSFAVNTGSGTVSAAAVTINQPRGKITYTSPSISAGTAIAVTFTNSYITSTSLINIGLNGNGSNLTGVTAYVKSQTAGSCVINIQNLSLLNLFNTGFIIDYLIIN